MPRTCDRDGCNGAVRMVDDNGVTDPDYTRTEQYECEYGHYFTIRLEGML